MNEDNKQNKQIFNYGLDVDNQTLEQFKLCYDKEFVVKGALMPDAHIGYVAPIGSVLVTKGFVVPAWVGYDIGCGVTAIKLSFKEINEQDNLIDLIIKFKNEIYNEVKQNVPMGLGKVNSQNNIHRETIEKFREILLQLENSEHDMEIFDWIKRKAPSNLGSLGEGNHFIEIEKDDDNCIWIVIHSGSRNIGHKVAQKYMIKSAGKNKDFEDTFPLDIKSSFGKEYMAILNFGLEFALLNRLEIGKKVVECIETIICKEIHFEVWTNKNHNHAIFEKDNNGDLLIIHRKGATPAKENERGVIPGTMRDGCYLVEGLGNKEFIESSSHGAGRKLSRKQAKEKISMEEFSNSMKGILGTVKESTLDEAPDAYKNIVDVMSLQKESVKIIKKLSPIINWKG